MNDQHPPSRTVRLTLGCVGLGLVLGLGTWVIRSDFVTMIGSTGQPASTESAANALSSERVFASRDAVLASPKDDQGAEPRPPFLASNTSRPSDPLHDEDVEPHPINEERLRMADHHAILARLTETLKHKDYGRARDLIADHKRQFGDEDGWRADRLGYERLLECLESPSQSAHDRAEVFIHEERLSSLRRHVRRVCLEGRNF